MPRPKSDGNSHQRDANPEFLYVLSKVVSALQQAMHDTRLPELTAENYADWFNSITADDVRCVLNALHEGTKEHQMVMKTWSEIAKRAPCKTPE